MTKRWPHTVVRSAAPAHGSSSASGVESRSSGRIGCPSVIRCFVLLLLGRLYLGTSDDEPHAEPAGDFDEDADADEHVSRGEQLQPGAAERQVGVAEVRRGE